MTSLWLATARQAIDRAHEGRCELSKSRTSAVAAAITDGAFNNLAHTPLSRGTVGAYLLQAAIAAIHDEAASAADTDNHRLDAVRGHLLEMNGDHQEALDAYVAAASQSTSPSLALH